MLSAVAALVRPRPSARLLATSTAVVVGPRAAYHGGDGRCAYLYKVLRLRSDLESWRLLAARFAGDGTGRWLDLGAPFGDDDLHGEARELPTLVDCLGRRLDRVTSPGGIWFELRRTEASEAPRRLRVVEEGGRPDARTFAWEIWNESR